MVNPVLALLSKMGIEVPGLLNQDAMLEIVGHEIKRRGWTVGNFDGPRDWHRSSSYEATRKRRLRSVGTTTSIGSLPSLRTRSRRS